MTTATRTDTPTSGCWTVERAAASWSALLACVGMVWLARPGSHPDFLASGSGQGSTLALVHPTVAAAALLLLGIGGPATVAARLPRAVRGTVGIVYGVVFCLAVPDMSVLSTAGYLLALCGPPALLVGALVLSTRSRLLRAGLALAALGTAVVLTTVGVDGSSFAAFAAELGDGFVDFAPRMAVLLGSFGGGLLWLAVALRAFGLRRAPAVDVTPPARDWGWWATVLAVLLQLPYALLRMTWLTPWPQFAPDDVDDIAMRAFGVSMGLAGLAGAVLTSGLIARWGKRYPRWLPVVGGRVVSPTWPAALAAIVGLAATVAGRSMVQVALTAEDGVGHLDMATVLLVMPLPVWGPLLVVAAAGYYRRRTTA